MSFRYNEAFENPDYHFSETLELDRIRPSQLMQPTCAAESADYTYRNPYDASPYTVYEDYDGEGSRGRSSPAAIPMDSMRSRYDVERSPRVLAFDMPNSHLYEHAHINPSFDYEPESAYTLPNYIDAPSNPYGRRPSDTPDGVTVLQRRNRREADMAFLAPSNLLQLDPERYNEEKQKQEENLIQNLAAVSTRERMKAIQKLPKTMNEKREISKDVYSAEQGSGFAYQTLQSAKEDSAGQLLN